jgi:hypothetical protein
MDDSTLCSSRFRISSKVALLLGLLFIRNNLCKTFIVLKSSIFYIIPIWNQFFFGALIQPCFLLIDWRELFQDPQTLNEKSPYQLRGELISLGESGNALLHCVVRTASQAVVTLDSLFDHLQGNRLSSPRKTKTKTRSTIHLYLHTHFRYKQTNDNSFQMMSVQMYFNCYAIEMNRFKSHKIKSHSLYVSILGLNETFSY